MRRRFVAISMAMVVCLGLTQASLPLAMARQSSDCASRFEDKTPVLMVHGQNGNPDVWSDSNVSMSSTVSRVKDTEVVTPFDYEDVHSEWVTNKEIGPKLAEYIDCLSQNSLKGGGKGKVIVVAHSMGSLATRYALSQTVNGRKVADAAGLVVTIGAPNLGSLGANLCEELAKVKVNPQPCQGSATPAMKVGSKELTELPLFPPLVPVKTIAGDVTLNTVILPPPPTSVPVYVRVPMNGDLVVSVKSASKFSTQSGRGDGEKQFACDGWLPIPSNSDAPCEHSNLLKMPEVQQEVKASIEQYIASMQKPNVPPGRKAALFNKLTFTYLNTWSKGINTPGAEDIVDHTNCPAGAVDCPHIFIIDANSPQARATYGDPIKAATRDCYLEQDENGHKPYESPKLKGTETIDGEPAEYYEQVICPPYLGSKEKSYLWYARKRGVFITASDGSEAMGGVLALDKLKAVIANIDWK